MKQQILVIFSGKIIELKYGYLAGAPIGACAMFYTCKYSVSQRSHLFPSSKFIRNMRYNIIQRPNKMVMVTLIFCVAVTVAKTQNTTDTAKAIKIVKTIEDYRNTASADSNQRMVGLQQYVPTIILDLRYASLNNFMNRLMYTEQPNFTFMRLPAAKALAMVQNELNTKGFGLKIYDAYRPYFVTVKFWELVHDDRYVADPKKGSGHNRGIAVDLTIINLVTKKELEMPTGFDNFTDSAHHDFMTLSAEVLRNRALLKETMKKYGFTEFATEWWHYSLPNPEKYDALDLSFGALKNETK